MNKFFCYISMALAIVILLAVTFQPTSSWAQPPANAPGLTNNLSLEDLIKSAKAGDPRAQMTLGKRYAAGDGIEKNKDLARDWLGEAADRNYGLAMLELGKLYFNNGNTTPADRIVAYKWLTLAESKGYSLFSEEAKLLKKQLVTAMTTDEIYRGQKAAQDWRPVTGSVAKPQSK
jgi:TPR repeat protein